MKNDLKTFAKAVANNPSIQAEIAENTGKYFIDLDKSISAKNPSSDPRAYMLVICILGILTIAAFIAGMVAMKNGKVFPEYLIAMGSTSLGALAGILAKNPPAPTGED